MDQVTHIYSLSDPTTGEIRYIGKAKKVSQRINEHICESRTGKERSHKINWINSLLENRTKPVLEVIDTVPLEEWVFWEMFYISLFKSWGFNLTNGTQGGDCGPSLSGEKNGMYRKTHTPEVRAYLSALKKKLVGPLAPQFGKPSKLKGKKYEQIMRGGGAEARRERNRIAMKGKRHTLGRKHTKESKKLQSEIRFKNNQARVSLIVKNLKTNTVKKYIGITNLIEDYPELTRYQINNMLKGKTTRSNKSTWPYLIISYV